MPRYWTGFDVAANVVGYVPLGFLLALSFRAARQLGAFAANANWRAVTVAVLAGAVLSLCDGGAADLPAVARALQRRLRAQRAGRADRARCWPAALELAGAIDRWSRFRVRWFVDDARGALVLLALWPFALLFPAAVPLGLGQVLERLESALADWLLDTPFLEWLPVRDVELQPLVPGAELLCVALGALVPCLLGYSVIRSIGPARRVRRSRWHRCGRRRRHGLVGGAELGAGRMPGPGSACRCSWACWSGWCWRWCCWPCRGAAAPRWCCWRWCVHLSVLNQAPASAYFAHTLQAWEQGRFIRFNGLAQWLGWLWPYAALVYVLVRVSRARRAQPRIAG